MFAKNSLVRVFDSHVEKYASSPQDVAMKYAAVASIGREHGFVAPKVIEVRDDHVVLERLHGITSLQKVYLSGDLEGLAAAVRRAGEVLGHLHRHLPRESASPWTAPGGFAADLRRYSGTVPDYSGLPQAVLHCDFSFANVFVASPGNKIAVIDPCPNFASTHEVWTYGPVYLDLGKMLSCLEGQIPARHQMRRLSPAKSGELQQAFLEGYSLTASTPDAEVAHSFAYATASSQFRRRFGALGALHRTALYSRLRGNFPLHRKLSSWIRSSM